MITLPKYDYVCLKPLLPFHLPIGIHICTTYNVGCIACLTFVICITRCRVLVIINY